MNPELLDPTDPRAPRYWMWETSGILKPVVERYLNGGQLAQAEVQVMRAYLQQWIDSPVWAGPAVRRLRKSVKLIRSRVAIDL